MKAGSIRLNLLAWLVAPGLLVLGIGAWLSYQQAQRLSTLVTDRQLIASARMIAEQIGYSEGSLRLVIPPAALELFASDSHDEVAYSVTDPNGVLLAGYPGLDAPGPSKAPVGSAESRYFDTVFRNEEAMRAVSFPQSVVTPTGTITVNVAVGETLKSRDALVMTLWTRGFLEQAALVVAGVISIWFGIARELQPLLRLRQEVRGRAPDQFEPFNADAVQSELRPMVLALNRHMDRLKGQIERQRRFLDSAAHQLRTPLATMKTQIGYARRTHSEAEVRLALGEVDTNLSSLARMTSQLLLLGGVDHSRSEQPSETSDMSEIAKQVVLECAHRGLDAGIELAFETNGPALVTGSRVMLHELVVNLVENVLLHAGEGSTATIGVRRAVREVVIRVEDDGRGVPDEDRPMLLHRFQRGKNARPGGSGLGLSIVAELAESLGGRVELPAPRNGKGFTVAVFLPASGEPAPRDRV